MSFFEDKTRHNAYFGFFGSDYSRTVRAYQSAIAVFNIGSYFDHIGYWDYAISLLLLVWAFAREGLSSWYWVGIVLAAGVAVYHYFLIRHRTREGCFAAFNHNNWFGVAVFLGVLLGVFFK